MIQTSSLHSNIGLDLCHLVIQLDDISQFLNRESFEVQHRLCHVFAEQKFRDLCRCQRDGSISFHLTPPHQDFHHNQPPPSPGFPQKPSVVGMWIFSGNTHSHLFLFLQTIIDFSHNVDFDA